MYTDPAVVRRKIERELNDFVERIDQYRARGIWVLEYRFPELLVVFAANQIKPYAIAPYAVLMDFGNYDIEPPSIRFVNPFTREPLKKREIATELSRLRPVVQPPSAEAPSGQGLQSDRFLQWWTDDDLPFICLQGVREYHNNPGHTGDPWWLHRAKGAGSIIRLLELISKYGTEPMLQLNFQMQFQVIGVVQRPVVDVQ